MKSTTQTPYDISHPIAQAAAPMEQAAVQWATQEAEAYLARVSISALKGRAFMAD